MNFGFMQSTVRKKNYPCSFCISQRFFAGLSFPNLFFLYSNPRNKVSSTYSVHKFRFHTIESFDYLIASKLYYGAE